MDRPQMSRTMLRGLCFALAFTTLACGDRGDRASTDTAGGAVADAAVLDVADVQIGKSLDANRRVAEETDDFARRDTVYAVVRTTGTASSATLTGRWMFEDGQVVDERSETISPSGEAYTEFHITQANGLPAGKYTFIVLLNGGEAERAEFEVK
ncbi:MAG: hypothetical protein ACT4PJ_07965 [Gemmatimonadaceae bacterium]